MTFAGAVGCSDPDPDEILISLAPEVISSIDGTTTVRMMVVGERTPLELYLEVAPGYDVHRTASCTLRSGVDSVCPHAAASRGFVDVVLGARWYIGG